MIAVFSVGKLNTLRNQILFVFVIVMVIVLVIVGIMTFNRVSAILKNNAEDQMKQVAAEASGRFDSLYEQINMVTKQIATNEDVQQLLKLENQGIKTTFSQRQSLMDITNTLQANADGIYSVELYTSKFKKILPLSSGSLLNRLDGRSIFQANQKKGGLVWVGQDPKFEDYFLAIRQVSLMDNSFRNGGYLLIQINKSYFKYNAPRQTVENQLMIVLDQRLNPVVSNYSGREQELLNTQKETVTINNTEYMIVSNKSDSTNWTLLILTPVQELVKGMDVLRTIIIVSGLVGFVFFSICSLFLTTFITRPIIQLTNTMRQASKGALSQNPSTPSTVEIHELNNTYNQLVEETNHLIQMVYEKELTKNRSELKALQAQIHPHFLFNTLDSLYWALDEKEENELAELVLAMSKLFRYTISKNLEGEWVSIKEEMEQIDRYMLIMRMRFGERLKWIKDVPEQWERVKIPKLLIQPLVENAILHGAGNKIGDCHVCVTVTQSEKSNRLLITVQDDGPGMDNETIEWIYKTMNVAGVNSEKGSGIAISNVHKRLHLYFSHEDVNGLIIESQKNKGTRIYFEIPIYGGESLNARENDFNC
ncbi:cache domain-containing sensor histidine kinase [Aquibacillus salsiterrae]|uniref:Sensor histidine kinase n=1 Tax=Aquibacillus salsiterrae TaxID=2950439 RepID=A0A9X3WC35_9BACI|nr:sensor histidine kinase [Aquibacillus salsiterrae]MDC3416068.1 sensor histidine kinase [Aquibacillus salsiterrae]